MEKEITIHDLERRLAALEKVIASLTAEKNNGKFAHIGGIERHPARSFEGSQSVDLSEAYGETGKRVG